MKFHEEFETSPFNEEKILKLDILSPISSWRYCPRLLAFGADDIRSN